MDDKPGDVDDKPGDTEASGEVEEEQQHDARLRERLRADMAKLSEDPVQWIGDIPKTPWPPGAKPSKGTGAKLPEPDQARER